MNLCKDVISLDNHLEHFGVKGMKWGKHKKKEDPKKVSKFQLETYYKLINSSTPKNGGSTKISNLAAKTHSTLTKSSSSKTKVSYGTPVTIKPTSGGGAKFVPKAVSRPAETTKLNAEVYYKNGEKYYKLTPEKKKKKSVFTAAAEKVKAVATKVKNLAVMKMSAAKAARDEKKRQKAIAAINRYYSTKI